LISSHVPAHRSIRRLGLMLGALVAIAAVAVPAAAAAVPKKGKG
jgi:hypothetical protein